jgi:hypothetical protein
VLFEDELWDAAAQRLELGQVTCLAGYTVKPAMSMHCWCYGRRSSMESTRVTLKFKQFGSTRLIFLHCNDAHVHVYKCTFAAKQQQKDVIGLYFPNIVVLLLCFS